jgi:hypothetical protein
MARQAYRPSGKPLNTDPGSISTDLLAESRKLQRDMTLSAKEYAEIQAKILQGQIKSKSVLHQIYDELYAQQLIEGEHKQLIEDKAKILNEILKGPLKKGLDMTEASYKLEREILKKAKERGEISDDAFLAANKNLRNLKKQFVITSDMTDDQKKNVQAVRKNFEDQMNAVNSISGGIKSALDKIPGGDILADVLDLDKLSEALQKAVLNGLNLKGLAAGVAIIGSLLAVAASLADEADKFSAATGVTFGLSRKIADESRSIANNLDIQLARNEDILKVQEKTITNFGTTLMLSTKQAASVAELGAAYGYGADTAAEFNNVMMTMGASASEAYDVQSETAALALKSGVAVGAVTKDIAQHGKAAMKYFGGNAKAMGNAAVEAARMGMSLDSLVKTSDSLLNIQDSLTKQFEFQALTGRQLDLDKARQLAYEGDIAGAAKETLDALEKSGDISSLTAVAKRKAAEAAGMEVSDLEKALVVRKKLAGMDKDTIAAAAGLNMSADELAAKDKDQILTEVKKQQAISQSAAEMDDLKNTLLVSIAPAAEGIAKLFQGLAPILKIVGALLTPIAWIIEGMAMPFEAIGTALTWINNQLAEWFGGTEKLDEVMKYVKGTFIIIGGVLGGIILPAMYTQLKLTLQNARATAAGLITKVQEAISSIFTASASGGLIGLAIAGGAVAGLMMLLGNASNVGDAAFGAGGGTAILSPTEGAIFPSRNDEIAVGPGVIGMAQAGGSPQTVVAGGGGADMTETNNLLRALLSKESVAVVNWGDRDTTTLQNKLTSDRSLRQSNIGGTA